VEIQFHAWKQALNIGKALNCRSNEHHMQSEVLTAMIAHQLGMKAAVRIGAIVGRAMVSYERLYASPASHVVKARDLAGLCGYSPKLRHIKRDKRRRLSHVESGILALG